MNKIKFEEIQDTELAATIAQFQVAMALETENLALEPSIVTAGVLAVIQDPRKGTYYCAKIDDVVVASLLCVPEWSDWRNKTVIWIHSVYVMPEHRGQGVFKEMYSHLKNMVCDTKEFAGLRLYVDKNNKNAQQVYHSLGMSNNHYTMFEWLS